HAPFHWILSLPYNLSVLPPSHPADEALPPVRCHLDPRPEQYMVYSDLLLNWLPGQKPVPTSCRLLSELQSDPLPFFLPPFKNLLTSVFFLTLYHKMKKTCLKKP